MHLARGDIFNLLDDADRVLPNRSGVSLPLLREEKCEVVLEGARRAHFGEAGLRPDTSQGGERFPSLEHCSGSTDAAALPGGVQDTSEPQEPRCPGAQERNA
jgi:hypothetical protein